MEGDTGLLAGLIGLPGQGWWVFVAVGAVAGILAGCFGIGGGIVIVPVLLLVFSTMKVDIAVRMHLAIGTSLATIVFTSLSSIRSHQKRGAILWHAVLKLTPGIILGGLAGAALADRLDFPELKNLFGVILILIAINIALDLKPRGERPLPALAGMIAAGAAIGIVSALSGIGGGALSNPFLLWRNVDIRQSVATAAACTFPVACAAAAGFIVSGWHEPGLPAHSVGYIYYPAVIGIAASSVLMAPLGARLAHTLPVGALRRALAVLLVLVGLRLLLG